LQPGFHIPFVQVSRSDKGPVSEREGQEVVWIQWRPSRLKGDNKGAMDNADRSN